MRTGILAILLICCAAFAQQVEVGEPLKDEYLAGRTQDMRYFDTGKKAVGYDVSCDVGTAVPDVDREGWFGNQPIDGLKLELRAMAVTEYDPIWVLPTLGVVLFVRDGEILKQLKCEILCSVPFEVWPGKGETEISIGNYLNKINPWSVEIDLINGGGFYREIKSGDPKYFLSNCRRTKKHGLPVYNFDFSQK